MGLLHTRSSFPTWRMLLRLASRNTLRHRGRSAIVLVAIALGVAAIIIAGGFIHDVYVQFGEAIIHSQYGHFQIYRKGYTAHGTQRPTEYLIDSPERVAKRVRALHGVEAVLARLRFTGVANAGGGDLPVVAEGVEPDLENQLGSSIHLMNGRLLAADDRFSLILGEGVAKALHVGPGRTVSLNIVTHEGALNSLEFDVVGVFRSNSKEFDQRAVRLPLAAAQELLVTPGINEVVVVLADTRATEALAVAATNVLGSVDYEVKTWRDLADFYAKTVRLFDRQFGFLQIVLLLMIVLSVTNAINTAVFERLPEFGTMLALGDRGSDVFRLIMAESMVLGLVGSTLGVVMGVTLALAISAVGIDMPPPPNTSTGYVALIRIVPSVLGGAFAVGVASALLAGIIPSLKIARLAPVEALRRAV